MLASKAKAVLVLLGSLLVASLISAAGDGRVACVEPSPNTLDGGPLPIWATGDFSFHGTDVYNLRIVSDGGFLLAHSGGDVASCLQGGSAEVVQGQVRLSWLRGDFNSERDSVTVIKTDDDRIFVGGDGRKYFGGAIGSRSCAWIEYEKGSRCGVDVGGCGGYGKAVSCSFEQAAAHCPRPTGDAGP